MTDIPAVHTVRDRRRAIVQILLSIAVTACVLVVLRPAWLHLGGAKHAHAAQADSLHAATPTQPKILYWYDPMHPGYRSDKPGIAPDCGMALVPKYAEQPGVAPVVGSVTLSQSQQQLAGVRTATVESAHLTRELRTTAEIVADESRIAHIHVKTAGFIDQISVDEIGQRVHKGDALFKLYSPDLVAAEQEYLIARRGMKTLSSSPIAEVRDGSASLLASAREKLRLLDVTDAQIARLEASGEASRDLTFYSPVEGFVTDRKAFLQTSVTPDTEL